MRKIDQLILWDNEVEIVSGIGGITFMKMMYSTWRLLLTGMINNTDSYKYSIKLSVDGYVEPEHRYVSQSSCNMRAM